MPIQTVPTSSAPSIPRPRPAAPPVTVPAATSGPRPRFAISKPPENTGIRVGIYGPGGIGKTTLAGEAPGQTAFFDIDNSLGVLQLQRAMQVPVSNWQDILDALAAPIWGDTQTIVVDSATAVEEWAKEWVIRNVPHEKQGIVIRRIEDYGFGKGLQHIYDAWLALLSALDAHVRAGRNVVLVMHDCTASVPNPAGEDYLRYEPRLQSPPSGKNSIRHRTREWLDHLLFVGYDIAAKDGKARGNGSRTIWPVEQPHCMAKSRKLADQIVYQFGSDELWRALMPAAYEGSK